MAQELVILKDQEYLVLMQHLMGIKHQILNILKVGQIILIITWAIIMRIRKGLHHLILIPEIIYTTIRRDHRHLIPTMDITTEDMEAQEVSALKCLDISEII